jgi:hypothetical protein
MDQLTIKFPGDVDFESFWMRLGAIRPSPKAEPVRALVSVPVDDNQLVIAETEMNVALRLSFRVPVFAKTGMLKAWDLKMVAISNVISVADFAEFYKYDANKVAKEFIEGARAKLVKLLGLTEEQSKLVEFRGLSTCRHLTTTRVDASDPRWV